MYFSYNTLIRVRSSQLLMSLSPSPLQFQTLWCGLSSETLKGFQDFHFGVNRVCIFAPSCLGYKLLRLSSYLLALQLVDRIIGILSSDHASQANKSSNDHEHTYTLKHSHTYTYLRTHSYTYSHTQQLPCNFTKVRFYLPSQPTK